MACPEHVLTSLTPTHPATTMRGQGAPYSEAKTRALRSRALQVWLQTLGAAPTEQRYKVAVYVLVLLQEIKGKVTCVHLDSFTDSVGMPG